MYISLLRDVYKSELFSNSEDNAPVSVESQINPCPEGEPLANAAGGKLTCSGASTGPCPQGSFCIVGVCCSVAARPFTGPIPSGAGGSNSGSL